MFNNFNPDRTAIISIDGSISYSSFFYNVHSFGKKIENIPANRIAIWGENSPQWIYAFFAAWEQDATVVPIDFMSSAEDVAYILNDCKPEVLFVSPELRKQLPEILPALSYEPELVELLPFSEKSASRETLHIDCEDDKTALIIYTSGTTGSPKGVMLSFGNLFANVDAVSKHVPIFTPDRQTLMLLPLHHIFPLLGSMVAPLLTEGTVVMAPSMQPADVAATLKDNQVSVMIGVPRLYEMLHKGIKAKIDTNPLARRLFKFARRINNKSFSKRIFKKVHDSMGGKLDVLVVGGAKLDVETGEFFEILGFNVLEGFGMTEAAPMITFPRPGMQKIGTTGQALPNCEVEIRDGEVAVRGPQVMQGYYNRPEETAEVLRDGWLYTGDFGKLDSNGYLTITGRKKEIIVLSNGKNINPVELEQKLEKVEEIQEVAVFMHEEVLHAVIVPDPSFAKGKSVKELETFFKTNTLSAYNASQTPYKRINRLSVSLKDLPRTRLSKIQRFRLSEYIQNDDEQTLIDEKQLSAEFLSIKGYLESQIKKTVLPKHDLDFDLGIDSLGRLGLLDFIDNTFGMQMSEEDFARFSSVGEIADYVSANKQKHDETMVDWTQRLSERVNLSLPKSWITLPIIKNIARLYTRLYFRFKSSGVNNLPEGPCIIAPNHQSFIDGLFIVSLMRSKQVRQTFFYTKKKHVNNKLLSSFAKRNNIIVMDHKDLHLSIQKMAEVLKRGKKLIIFPEGTRSHTGELGDFKKTFAILSKELNVPVVPVAINGAFKALPRGRFFPKAFTHVQVNILSPVYPLGASVDTIVNRVQASIFNRLRS